jgi:hypothetical protein
MNLLKLSAEMRELLPGLEDPREIRLYFERKLRHGVFAADDNFFGDKTN